MKICLLNSNILPIRCVGTHMPMHLHASVHALCAVHMRQSRCACMVAKGDSQNVRLRWADAAAAECSRDWIFYLELECSPSERVEVSSIKMEVSDGCKKKPST